MRHFLATCPIATRPIGMREPPAATALVTPSGSTLARCRARAAQSPAQSIWPRSQQVQIRLWVRQSAHRNSRADRASLCPDRQPPRRRTSRLPGYWPCIRLQHGVGHGVDAGPPSRPRRHACPQGRNATPPLVTASAAPPPATRSHLSNNSGHASPPAHPAGRLHREKFKRPRQKCAGARSHRHSRNLAA